MSKAQELLRQAKMATARGHLEARIFLGSRLLELGDWAEAREQFERVLRVDPFHRDAIIGLGEALSRTGDREGARQAVQRAIELYPGEEGGYPDPDERSRANSAQPGPDLWGEGGKSDAAAASISPRLTDPFSDFADEDDDADEDDEPWEEDELDEPWLEHMGEGSVEKIPVAESPMEKGKRAPQEEGQPLVLESAPEMAEEEGFGSPDLRPAEVILSSKTRMREKYGEGGFLRISEKLATLAEAVSAATGMEAHLVYVDDQNSLAAYGLQPVDFRDPFSIRSLLVSLEKVLASRGQKGSFLLLVGGEGIIPFFRLPNPTDDPDGEVLSDAPYAADNYFLPRRAVGRIPDGNSSDPTLLLALLQGTIAAHLQNRRRAARWLRNIFGRKNGKSLALTAQIWKEASALVFSAIGSPRRMEVSPPASDLEFLERHQELPSLAYFNLHGLEDSPYWYGHQVSGEAEEFPIALTPQNLVWSLAPASVVFSEACYGAKFVGHQVEESLALSFLAAGARGFIGSTAMSYGALRPPLSGADLLGVNLWRGLTQGYALGEALRRAKLGLVEEMGMRQGFLDGEDQKTILSFILLGDPSLPAPAFNYRRKLAAAKGQEVFCPGVVCGHKSREMEAGPVPEEVLAKVQKEVQQKVPFVREGGLRVRSQVLCNGECACTGHRPHGKGQEGARVLTNSLVFSAERVVPLWGDRALKQVLKVTTDPSGKVLKLAVSK